jgi:hypothetical protein
VIALLALLLATTVDGADEARRRARLNEVTNRLGVRVEPPARDLHTLLVRIRKDIVASVRARLGSQYALGPDWLWPPLARKALFELSALLWNEAAFSVRSVHLEAGAGPGLVWNYLPDPVGLEDGGELVHILLPRPGTKNAELEKYVPWTFREIGRDENGPLLEQVFAFLARPDRRKDGSVTLSNYMAARRHYEEGIGGRAITVRTHWIQIMDWVDAEGVDLYRYDLEQAVRAQQEWHDRFRRDVHRGQPTSRGIVWVRWPDGATVERLCTPELLEQEGASMGHCVGGYWPDVRDDKSIIYSYRDPAGVPQATVELKPYEEDHAEYDEDHHRGLAVQLQGPNDAAIQDDLARVRMAAFLMPLPVDFVAQVEERLALPIDTSNAEPHDIDSIASEAAEGAAREIVEQLLPRDPDLTQTEMDEVFVQKLLEGVQDLPSAMAVSMSAEFALRSKLSLTFEVYLEDGDREWQKKLGWIEARILPPSGDEADRFGEPDRWETQFVVHDEALWARVRCGEPVESTIGTFGSFSDALLNPTWFPPGAWQAVKEKGEAGLEWVRPALDAALPQSGLVELGLVTVRKGRDGKRHEIAP